MSDNTYNPTLETLEELQKGEGQYYRNRRWFFSFLGSFCILFLTAHPFIAFVSYVLFGLFFDWLFFAYGADKESEQSEDTQTQAAGIPPNTIDGFNQFMLKVRRSAFITTIPTTTVCLLFFPNIGYELVFIVTYVGINFGSMLIAAANGRIMWPYRFKFGGDYIEEDSDICRIKMDRFDPTSESALVNPFFGIVIKPRNPFD